MSIMDGFRTLGRRLVASAALGLLATAILFVPPTSVAVRVDGWLFGWAARTGADAPPRDFLLVTLDEPAALDPVVEAAEKAQAALVVATQFAPPTEQLPHTMGPVEVSIGARRSRATAWARGGHLVFEADMDGVVRHDRVLSGNDGDPVESLPLFAARTLASARSLPPPAAAETDLAFRFHPGGSFETVSADEARRDPDGLRNRVLVVGSSRPDYSTPVGPMSTAELVANAIDSHLRSRWIRAGTPFTAVAWALAAVGLAAARSRSRRTSAWRLVAAAGAIVLVGLAGGAWGGVWLAPTGPAAWLLLTAGAFVWPDRQRATVPTDSDRPMLVDARRAMAAGRLDEAWTLYRQMPVDAALLAELYELGLSLEEQGSERVAADVYHRIVHADARFRDAAHRLIATGHHSEVDDAQRSEMPETLGRYQLLEPIGQGAMGHVYLGRDPIINRIVAIKAIDLRVDYDSTELASVSESFLREATIAGRLSHPNIVTIFDVGETDGVAYMAMEYLKGRHLSEFASPDHLLPVDTVLDLLSQTADALAYAHDQNIVHRDIKPANIMYDSASESVKITDFGIAKLIDANRTRTGIVLGTPAFMSPEQLEGRNVNRHTDLFALGVTLYQLLTGQLPFRGASMTNLMFVIANEPHRSITAVRGDLPPWLDTVIDRALAKDPADRYQSGAEMAAALRFGLARAA
jgi:hypothetical protein